MHLHPAPRRQLSSASSPPGAAYDVGWCAPFVVQFLVEYVIEICTDVDRFVMHAAATHPSAFRGLRHFAQSNPDFMALTRDRAASYWSAYYRADCSSAHRYPAIRALRRLEGGPL